MDKEVRIDYVNARKDNRPPSIKCDDGNYYTISDDAYQSMLPWKGNVGQISYTTNAKGFHQATHWNGAELPRGDVRRTPAATGIPQPPPQQPQTFHPPADKPVPFGYVSTTQGRLRTMPSVKEQFCQKVVEAAVSRTDGTVDTPFLVAALQNAKTAWEQVMEAQSQTTTNLPPATTNPQPATNAPPWEPPPPNSPDDYLG